ncbi:hypothetical protein MA16_Dca021472 [Dendrobium catenatum]|uniref:Uncharacterized protein n=1 Tax=Dendrobium catenatum TaxID=906689 RepID=A0A2I0WZ71_9ASPA|nr:hypothetical protein MA16_Dca021472 [Dendrobium catenatum]
MAAKPQTLSPPPHALPARPAKLLASASMLPHARCGYPCARCCWPRASVPAPARMASPARTGASVYEPAQVRLFPSLRPRPSPSPPSSVRLGQPGNPPDLVRV